MNFFLFSLLSIFCGKVMVIIMNDIIPVRFVFYLFDIYTLHHLSVYFSNRKMFFFVLIIRFMGCFEPFTFLSTSHSFSLSCSSLVFFWIDACHSNLKWTLHKRKTKQIISIDKKKTLVTQNETKRKKLNKARWYKENCQKKHVLFDTKKKNKRKPTEKRERHTTIILSTL